MKKVLRTALAGMLMLTLGVGLVACGDTAAAGSDKVAATVNGVEIPETEVQAYIESYRATDETLSTDEGWTAWLEEAGMTEDELRLQVIDIFVQEEVIRQAAEAEGLTVDDTEVDAQIDVVKSNYADDEAWQSALASAGYTEEEYRDTVGISLLYNALLEQGVTQPTATVEDIQEYLNSNALYYAGKKSSHILFATDDQATAEAVLAELQASTDLATDFAAAAAEYSTDSSASDGGNVGWDSLTSFVTEYSDALDALSVGQMSGLVESEYGFHIIM
ncbi:MAG: parvulin peptidyl-prolyl isomerase, partial [Actinobacteria bacterium]|nr:parvulin peptidyl-prolyl isomerase [Actinomycetota bacterium]